MKCSFGKTAVLLVSLFCGLPLHAQNSERTTSTGLVETNQAALGVLLEGERSANKLGIKVEGVLPSSPSAAAGVLVNDVLLQLDDQLLVNREQLSVLLSMREPKDQVSLRIRRDDEERVLAVRLTDKGKVVSSTPSVEFSVEDKNEQLSSQRSARIEDENGSAELKKKDGQPWLTVIDQQGVLVFKGFVASEPDVSKVPEPWRSSVDLLKRSYEQVVISK